VRPGPRFPFDDVRGVTLAELAVTLALLGLIMIGVVTTWSTAQQAYFVGSEAAEVQQNIRAAMDFMVRELRATGRDVTACAFDYAGAASRDCTAAKVLRCQTKLGGEYVSYSNVFAIPFVNARASAIQIRSDRNDSGTIAGTTGASASDASEENVVYALANGAPPCPAGVTACVIRDDGQGAVAMVAVDTQGLSFTYYPRPGYPPCDAVPPSTPCPPFALPLSSQSQADNVGRIRISLTSRTVIGGQPITRRLETDVYLKNRG
jgi:Tfp pilus assembly protein PilW